MFSISRAVALRSLAFVLGSFGSAQLAIAQTTPASVDRTYPGKPVRIIAASTGTSGDLLARNLGQQLSSRWGQSVIVENRTGAGAVIAAEVTARAAPDGYTVHIGQFSSFASAPSIYRKLSYDPLKDFAPITFYAYVPSIIVAHPSLSPNNLKEFVAYAKTRPSAINYSTGGAGLPSHLNFELLNGSAGLKLVHVPYKGVGAALTALLGAEVQVSSVVVPIALPQIKAGRVKAYAITSKDRFDGAPEIPTVVEAGFAGFNANTWFAMFAPTHTPPDIVRTLNRDMVSIIGSPATRTWLTSQGAQPAPGTPEELTAFLKSEIEKWGKVIRAADIKAD